MSRKTENPLLDRANMRKFQHRSGIGLFADFYSLSTFYDHDNFYDRELAHRLLPRVREELLKNAAACIISEMKHYDQFSKKRLGSFKLFDRFGLSYIMDKVLYYSGQETVHNLFKAYDLIIQHDALDRFIACTKCIFRRPEAFSASYGGPAWARISQYWLNLYNFDDCTSRDMFVHIDKLIDASHNTGRCLNKVYTRAIDDWLTQKTHVKDPYWVINQSCLQRYAKRRCKEQYNFTEEKFWPPKPKPLFQASDFTGLVKTEESLDKVIDNLHHVTVDDYLVDLNKPVDLSLVLKKPIVIEKEHEKYLSQYIGTVFDKDKDGEIIKSNFPSLASAINFAQIKKHARCQILRVYQNSEFKDLWCVEWKILEHLIPVNAKHKSFVYEIDAATFASNMSLASKTKIVQSSGITMPFTVYYW